MTSDLPRAVRLISQVLPPADREWIVGDLIEDAEDRGLRGARRGWRLTLECGAIAIGLGAQRVRQGFVLPTVQELVAGVAIDGRATLRASPASTAVCSLLLCGSIATLAFGVDVLVSTLLSAAGLHK